jgi:hypothetical protein
LGENRGSDEPTEDDEGQGFQIAVHGALLVKWGKYFQSYVGIGSTALAVPGVAKESSRLRRPPADVYS